MEVYGLRVKQLRPGLRTIKTGIAVLLAIVLTRLMTDEPLSLFYATLGAVVGMETTLSKAIRQGVTQMVGVLCGTVVGYGVVLLFPPAPPTMPPAWAVGLGLILLILLLNLFRLSFSLSLACLVFLWAVLMPTKSVFTDSLLRMRDTAVGVGTAIVLNVAVRPYNNKKRILSLLRRLRGRILGELNDLVIGERYPDLPESVALLRRLERELELYRSQRFLHRKNDEQALLYGCIQLTERMLQELEAICGMDSLGDLATENAERMRQMGLELPEADVAPRKCTRHDTIVMNYHLDKLLAACRCLDELTDA